MSLCIPWFFCRGGKYPTLPRPDQLSHPCKITYNAPLFTISTSFIPQLLSFFFSLTLHQLCPCYPKPFYINFCITSFLSSVSSVTFPCPIPVLISSVLFFLVLLFSCLILILHLRVFIFFPCLCLFPDFHLHCFIVLPLCLLSLSDPYLASTGPHLFLVISFPALFRFLLSSRPCLLNSSSERRERAR